MEGQLSLFVFLGGSETALGLLLTLLTVTYICLKFRVIVNNKRYPNGPWGVPIFGHLLFIEQIPMRTYDKWRNIYGDVFRIRLGSWNTVIVNGYEAIKEAAEKPDDAFSGRPNFESQKIGTDVLGEPSLAFGPFDESYLARRKHTAAAIRMFTGRMKTFTEQMVTEVAENLVITLLSDLSSKPKDITPGIRFAVGSFIFRFLYGHSTHEKEQIRTAMDSADRIVELATNANFLDVLPWLRYFMPWKVKQLIEVCKESDEVSRRMTEWHKTTFTKENIRDLTDAMLADFQESENSRKKQKVNKQSISKILHVLQEAGSDTTHKVLQWIMLYMANYPKVQKCVQEEIDRVVGNGRCVRLADRVDLPYTNATILEVLRMASLLPFALPKYTIKDTKVQGYDIDTGTVVFFNLYSVSHDKKFWGDPDIFRPSRLLNENNKLDMAKCSHILPFGLGRRRCIGEIVAKRAVFLMFATIIQRCTLEKPEGVDYDLTPIPGLTYSPKDFTVIVKER